VPLNWARHVDLETGRPVVNPDAYYGASAKPWLAMPGPLGAHNWHPMSFSPRTGLVYLPSFELGFLYVADAEFTPRQLAVNLGIDLAASRLPDDAQIKAEVLKAVRGHLVAWDPVQQRKVWDVEHAAAWNGGVLSTAGNLVFQGEANGDFSAYDAETGSRLWSFGAQEGIVAPPVSYAVDGVQYVAVLAGWGGVLPLLTGEIARKGSLSGSNGRILVFRLDGDARLPTRIAAEAAVPMAPAQFADTRTVEAGMLLYQRYCGGCHGGSAVSGGVLPDLRHSALLGSREGWSRIVRDGALESRGMVGFGREIGADAAEAIRAYVIERRTRAEPDIGR
jgi:alcohol dehydrogenase (cytochrome c)/quinohemoprotein ethanol dehydrogenase